MAVYRFEIEVMLEGEEDRSWQFVAYREHGELISAEQHCARIAKRLHSTTRLLIHNPAARGQMQHVFTFDPHAPAYDECGICGGLLQPGWQCTRCDDGRE